MKKQHVYAAFSLYVDIFAEEWRQGNENRAEEEMVSEDQIQ